MRIVEMRGHWREWRHYGDRSDMRKQGIGENTWTGDRSATDIFVGYRRGYYGKLIESPIITKIYSGAS